VRLINERRKDMDCNFTDRIHLGVVTDSDEIRTAIRENEDAICRETLAVDIQLEPLASAEPVSYEMAGASVQLYVVIVAED